MLTDAEALDLLEEMRQIPHVWLQLICNTRTPKGDLAWSLTVGYGTPARHAQYVSTSFAEVITNGHTHLQKNNVAAPSPQPKRKLKLKRSTT